MSEPFGNNWYSSKFKLQGSLPNYLHIYKKNIIKLICRECDWNHIFPALVINLNTFRSSLNKDYWAGSGWKSSACRDRGPLPPRGSGRYCTSPQRARGGWAGGVWRSSGQVPGFCFCCVPVCHRKPEDGTAVSLGMAAVSSPGHPQPSHSPKYRSRMSFAVVWRKAKSPCFITLVIKTTYPQLTLL